MIFLKKSQTQANRHIHPITCLVCSVEDNKRISSFTISILYVCVMLPGYLGSILKGKMLPVILQFNFFCFCAPRKWSGRSPSGRSVDFTTLTSSSCCRHHPYWKVDSTPVPQWLFLFFFFKCTRNAKV